MSSDPIYSVFIPFNSKNPYQPMLVEKLSGYQVMVEKRMRLKSLCLELVRKRRRGAIIHLHWLPHLKNGISGEVQRLLFSWRLSVLRWMGQRIVWTVHNLYGHESRSQGREKRLAQTVLKKASKILVHAPASVKLLKEEFGGDHASKIEVVPHGNYLESYPNDISRDAARESLGISPDAKVFLFFGYIRPYKGVGELIEAFRQVTDSDAVLLIAGQPLSEELAAELQVLAAQDTRINLNFGSVPDERAQEYMNAADVVVFPYQQVLTSGAVILAMSFGKACIAPCLGSIPDTLDDDQGAFLYDAGESDGLHKALLRALEGGGQLKAMGEYNLSAARQWDWQSIAGQTAKIYREALNCS